MKLRFAGTEDAPALLAIYAQYIGTGVTFEYDLPSVSEFARRIGAFSREFPYLICMDGEEIVGYAYAHRPFERKAYDWDVELSIYLDEGCTSRGVGRKMYDVLLRILTMQRVKTAYGLVTLPNEKSRRLHEKMGFHVAGILHNAGYKNGQWRDVCWFEKQLGEYEIPPQPVIPIGDLDPSAIQAILDRFSCGLAG